MVQTLALLDTILERSQKEDFFRIPSSWEEYEEISDMEGLNLQYQDGEIIVTSNMNTPNHEKLVARICSILLNYYDTLEDEDFSVMGSNGAVSKADEKLRFSPDIVVVKGEIMMKGKSKVDMLNPLIVVEILSKATSKFDLMDKLVGYKTMDSLKQIVFVAQDRPWVSTFLRTEDPNVWMNTDYFSLEDATVIDNLTVLMKDIYKKVTF